jgi:hypothetical protein
MSSTAIAIPWQQLLAVDILQLPTLTSLLLKGAHPEQLLISCKLVQVYHYHPTFLISGAKVPRMVCAPTSPALTLCAVSSFVSERANPAKMSSHLFFESQQKTRLLAT